MTVIPWVRLLVQTAARILLLVLALACACAWAVGGAGDIAAAASPTSRTVQGYTYDSPTTDDAWTSIASERGPPVADKRSSAAARRPAIDLASDGASARTDTAPSIDHTNYDAPRSLAHVDNATGTTGEGAQAIDGDFVWLQGADVAAKTATGAESALSGALLKTHLRQLEKYGAGGFRELESGRFRYYGELSPASKSGDMVGRRLVREWDPASGATRTWHETIDRSGNIRIVRPETGGTKTHYYFDEFGGFGGSW